MATEPITPIATPPPPTGFKGIFLRGDGLRAGWRFAIFLALYLVLSSLAILAIRALHLPLLSVSKFTAPAVLTQEIAVLAATFGATWIMSSIEGRPIGSYGLPIASAFGAQFWRGALWGIVMISAALLAIAAAGGVSFNGLAIHGRELVRMALLWALAFCAVGILEEWLFRGYILTALTDGIGFWPAASVVSAIFCLTHLGNHGEGWQGLPQIFVISMFFCLTLLRTGNLWFAVGLHAAWDFGETFIFSSPDSATLGQGTLLRSTFHGPLWLTGGVIGPEASVIGVLTVVLGMFLYARLYPARE
jgi:CAAX protease family protein